jgi:transposase
MSKKTTREQQYSDSGAVLYLAFELGNSSWKLGFSIGLGQKPRKRTIAAGDMGALQKEISGAKKRFHLAETVGVTSCYEAGRDGFWLHRYLTEKGIKNLVVDSSSIEVNRRARRAKADSLDLDSLLKLLIRHGLGEKKVWSVVEVPSPEEEDRRQQHREVSALRKEKTRTSNRIRGLLASQGIRLGSSIDLSEKHLEALHLWNGEPLQPGLKSRLKREWAHLVFLKEQIAELNSQRRRELREDLEPDLEKVRQLNSLRGIGESGSWVLTREIFGWRSFENGKQVGSLVGLTPSPYDSGDTHREQGISKAGNRRVRGVMIELAWGWIRYQPDSALTKWFMERFANGGKRARKVGIVAVARRLLIALWRFLETGALPEGAQLKATA